MTLYPDFYPAFQCRAGTCRHSCCKGWEIDVDDESCRYYDTVPGPLGERLAAAIVRDAEGAHFALTADERCPFLQRDGLCELICQLGEDALCDICALHPRFYLDYGEHTLCGLGLSCEVACALLLAERGPLRFLAEESGDACTLPQLLGLPAQALHFCPQPEAPRYQAVLDAFAATEPIDDAWTAQLQALRQQLPAVIAAAQDYAQRYDAGLFDRILAYILYRQLDSLEERGLRALLDYAALCAEFVFLTAAWTGDLAEALRRWSEQIEYSTENVAILLDAITAS